jgi:hypothetical protein
MTPDNLLETLANLTNQVVADPRWQNEQDNLGVSVLGLILYGYGLSVGRMVMMLDLEDINAAVKHCLMEHTGVTEKWTGGFIEAAAYSAFDPSFHPGQSELIEVGRQYMGEEDFSLLRENIFANIQSIRRQVEMAN